MIIDKLASMKTKILLLLISLFLCLPALAQNQGEVLGLGGGGSSVFCRVNTGGTVVADNTDANYLSCDTAGRLLIGGIVPGVTATSLGKSANTTVYADADTIIGIGGRVNTSLVTATNGRYAVPSLTTAGIALGNLIWTSDFSDALTVVKREDAAVSDQSALLGVGFVRRDSIAVSQDATGDWAHGSTDPYGGVIPGTWHSMVAQDNTLAFGSVTTAYATLITTTVRIRSLCVLNLLDRPVMLSFNASTGLGLLPATTGFNCFDFASNQVSTIGNISVKSLGGNPTSGNIYATAYGAT